MKKNNEDEQKEIVRQAYNLKAQIEKTNNTESKVYLRGRLRGMYDTLYVLGYGEWLQSI